MTKMVTRCPQCGTSFRITAAQLKTAQGAVRCGACLHIFRAQEHLVGSSAPASASASALVRKPASKTSAKPTPEPKASSGAQSDASSNSEGTTNKTNSPSSSTGLPFDQALIDAESDDLDDDDFLISDDLDQSPDAEDDGLDVASTHSTSSLFEREIKIPEEEPIDSTDESWAMNLLAEEDEQDEEIEVTPADNVIPADTSEQAIEAPSEPIDTHPSEPETNRSAAQTGIHFHLEASHEDDDEQGYAGDRLQAYDSERTALLMGIDPEPVEMDWIPSGSRRRKLMWAGLALLGLLILAAQVAWLQFDRLSRLEPYRGVYAAICPLAGCELPVLSDPSQIRAVNLVVRSHPDVDNALSVDAILLNTAPFEQPFPDLVLEFSDLEGDILAMRRFHPDEYLSGELAGRILIPRNQHIHVTLELVDPGPSAVSYRAYIAQ